MACIYSSPAFKNFHFSIWHGINVHLQVGDDVIKYTWNSTGIYTYHGLANFFLLYMHLKVSTPWYRYHPGKASRIYMSHLTWLFFSCISKFVMMKAEGCSFLYSWVLIYSKSKQWTLCLFKSNVTRIAYSLFIISSRGFANFVKADLYVLFSHFQVPRP